MRAEDIAARFRARRVRRGWLARCPAHDDRSPSLSIHEGRDGRVLVKCFAGCDPSAIMRTLDLSLSDLFTGERALSLAETNRQLSADEIQRELQVELERVLADDAQRCGFDVVELPRHRNEARAIIERRFDVCLKREATPWWHLEPHCIDPAWEICVDQAMRVAAARSDQEFTAFARAIAGLPQTQHRVLLLARRFQRELAQPAMARAGAS